VSTPATVPGGWRVNGLRVYSCDHEILPGDGLEVVGCTHSDGTVCSTTCNDGSPCLLDFTASSFSAYFAASPTAGVVTTIQLKLLEPTRVTRVSAWQICIPDGTDVQYCAPEITVGASQSGAPGSYSEVKTDLTQLVTDCNQGERCFRRGQWSNLEVYHHPGIAGVAQQDLGYSWGQILRFFPVTFTASGTFKLCFCDSTQAEGGACNSADDYALEVGTIHVSGVSCLLQSPKYRKATCCRHFWPQPVVSNGQTGTAGGYRCYATRGSCPTLRPPSFDDEVAYIGQQYTPYNMDLGVWCLFGPEEVTQHEPRCQLVAGYQSVGR